MARKSRKRNRKVETRKKKSESAEAVAIPEASTATEVTTSPEATTEIADKAANQETVQDSVKPNDAESGIMNESRDESQIIQAIEQNADLIREMMSQFSELSAATNGEPSDPKESGPEKSVRGIGELDPHSSIDTDEVLAELNAAADEIAELRDRNDELHNELARCRADLSDLKEQNTDLAKQVADSNVRQTVATAQSGSADAMSWEERRELIIQQMEAESFDADEFVENLSIGDGAKDGNGETDDAEQTPQTPLQYVNELVSRLTRAENDLVEREGEIHELRILLQNQSETRDGGVAIGAAAIAQMVDSDELVVAERERLQELQTQWEEKFRQSEIDASLERAKLSRERQELAKRASELEEQMVHMQRDAKEEEELGSNTSRRWMAKLGLANDE